MTLKHEKGPLIKKQYGEYISAEFTLVNNLYDAYPEEAWKAYLSMITSNGYELWVRYVVGPVWDPEEWDAQNFASTHGE